MNMFIKSALLVSALGLALPATSIFAKDQVYGWELMSEKERAEHRTKMQSMKTEQERERYRLEHHKKMEQRATKQGKTLPDMPQSHGGGMSSGKSSGGGGGGGGGKGH